MAIRIIVLIAIILAWLYGFGQKRKGYNRKYFDVVLCGVTALLLSRVYYLIIILSNGNDEIFTVGTLGQASAYLFFLTANHRYVSHEIWSGKNRHISVSGTVGTVVLAVLFILAAVRYGTLSAYVGEIIYAICMCSVVYSSFVVIDHRKTNIACGAVYKFAICVCLLTLFNALTEFAGTINQESVQTGISWGLTIAVAPTLVIMLPLLRKGMNSWAQ